MVVAAQAGAAAAQQALPPAAQLVEKYVQAIGGHDAVARLQARHVTADVSMPAMGMNMTMEMYSARPNKSVMRMEMSGMSMGEGYDGTTAWATDPMNGPRLLDGAELAQRLDMSSFDNGMDYARAFPKMETIGEKTVAGKPCWNVRLTGERGTVEEACFDKESGLLVATHGTRTSRMGEVTVDATYSEYKEFDGVRIPTVTNLSQGGQSLVITVKALSHAAVPDSTFAPPAEVKALQH
jgi:hypothetical protein